MIVFVCLFALVFDLFFFSCLEIFPLIVVKVCTPLGHTYCACLRMPRLGTTEKMVEMNLNSQGGCLAEGQARSTGRPSACEGAVETMLAEH